MLNDALHKQAAALLADCRKKGIMLATAESCTGGLIASVLTDIPGSSAVFERGFITYSNLSKTQMLGVDPKLTEEHGAVSQPVAVAMAIGALKHAKADLSVAVTGIAGPDGGTKDKPVGTVFIATAVGDKVHVEHHQFHGSRAEIRTQSVAEALTMLDEALSSFSAVA